MSRTDKTRPYDVKLFDSPRNYVEMHDHRDGICDLQPPGRGLNDGRLFNTWWGSWNSGTCGYTWSPTFSYSGAARCGCRSCQAPWDRHLRNRQRRQHDRREANDWACEYNAQRDIYDW